MAAEGILSEFGVKHAQISLLLTDNASDPMPTYSDPVDVPGIQGLNYELNYTEETLTGDDKVLDVQASLESVTLEIEHGLISHAVKAILEGGTHTLHATPSSKSTSEYHLSGGSESQYFKLEAVLTKTSKPGHVVRVVFHKVKATSQSSERSYGAFKTHSFSAQAVATLSSDKIYSEYDMEAGNGDDTTDMQAPQVASISPDTGDTAVDVAANIVITFDKALDNAFFTTAFFSVYDLTSSSNVAIATPAGSVGDTVVTLNPSSDLGLSKNIQVTVSGAVRDTYGNCMGSPYISTFTTEAS